MSYTRESRSSTSAVTPKCSTRGSIICQCLLLLLSVQHEGDSSFNAYCYFQVFNTRESRVEVFAYVRLVHSHWFGVVLVSLFTGACVTAYFPSCCWVYNFPICSQVFSITPPSTPCRTFSGGIIWQCLCIYLPSNVRSRVSSGSIQSARHRLYLPHRSVIQRPLSSTAELHLMSQTRNYFANTLLK